jgi:hypothetical protein
VVWRDVSTHASSIAHQRQRVVSVHDHK